MVCERGEIVLLPFPAGDHTSLKTRPALVVNSPVFRDREGRLLVTAITSNLKAHSNEVSHLISDWRMAGLLKASAVTTWMACCTSSMIKLKIGTLPDADLEAVDRCLLRALGLRQPDVLSAPLAHDCTEERETVERNHNP